MSGYVPGKNPIYFLKLLFNTTIFPVLSAEYVE